MNFENEIKIKERKILNRETDICFINNKLYNISMKDKMILKSLIEKISPFVKVSYSNSLAFEEIDYESKIRQTIIKEDGNVIVIENEEDSCNENKDIKSLIEEFNSLINKIEKENNIYKIPDTKNFFTKTTLNKGYNIEYYIIKDEKDNLNIDSLKQNIFNLIEEEEITGGYIYKLIEGKAEIIGYWSKI